MAILNYTTSIDSEKTIIEIQKNLAMHGANAVLSEYDDEGNVKGLSFKIRVNENDLGIKLPMDWKPILKILENDRRVPNRLRSKEQAIRVGWRIIKSWVDAQMAIYETEMVKMEQIFLPYIMTKNGGTLYDEIKSKQFLLSE